MMTRGAVIKSRIVAEPGHNRGGVERNVAAGTAEVLPGQTLLRTHLQDEVGGLRVLLLLGGSARRAHPVQQGEAFLVVAKPTHCNRERTGNLEHTLVTTAILVQRLVVATEDYSDLARANSVVMPQPRPMK